MSDPVKQAAIPVAVLLVIVSLGVIATWPSGPIEAEHYQRFQDGKSLYALLGSRIERGDSLEDVEGILGTGLVLTEDIASVQEFVRRESSLNPRSYPDGVQQEDVFINYPHGDESTTLQFRNGYLVNHDRTLFRDTIPGVVIQGREAGDRVSREGKVIEVKPRAGD